jgi:hypothetical protein
VGKGDDIDIVAADSVRDNVRESANGELTGGRVASSR